MASSLLLSLPHHLSLSFTKPSLPSLPHHLSSSSSSFSSCSLTLPLSSKPSLLPLTIPRKFPQNTQQSWTVSAVTEDALPSDITTAAVTETTQQVVSNGDDGVSTIISVLLLFAFIGLSVLTVGVIYIGVTDFLQKREREQFEKEEAAKKKKGSKKVKVRARAGPRGFGQKIDEDVDDGGDD